MEKNIPFVGFYSANNISPVSQNISDLKTHYRRRESLLRLLGILPAFIEGKSIIEFGPGGGHNAIYLASLSPTNYVLIDGNQKGANETRERLEKFKNINIKVHNSLFQEFQSEDKFDLVWAEGCLPHQNKPLSLLEHISSYTKSRGVICVSSANGLSYLSETIRRLFRDRFFDKGGSVEDQTKRLVPFLNEHLQNLRGMSRPVEDWILDSIVQPLHERKLLSIPEIVNCLGENYDVYGSSPRFITDWRWYKDIIGADRKFNELALENYFKTNLNLLDYRFEFPNHSAEFGRKLELIGAKSWELMCNIESGNDHAWQDFFNLMDELCIHIGQYAPETAEAIEQSSRVLKGSKESFNQNQNLNNFSKWWGRGQQYISLVKN